ncbi:MAG TPA: hypothetical protein VIC27_02015 [Ktedonobacterales bacterium]
MDISFNLAILWVSVLLALAVYVPLAIRIGPWVRGGAMTVAGGGALVASALFGWGLSAMAQTEAHALGSGPYPYNATELTVTFVIGGALLLAAWSMALVEAVRARRWGWRALLAIGVCATFAATYGFLAMGIPYTGATTACVLLSSNRALAPFCSPRTPLAALTLVFMVVGPAATLAYALSREGFRRHYLRQEAVDER